MPDADAELRRNAEATQRLRDLVERLDLEALGTSLGGGWTVAVALAHLAFWDGFQAAGLDAHLNGQPYPPEAADDAINAALEVVTPLVDPARAGAAAVQAAERIDAMAAGLPPERLEALLASELAYSVRRWRHREEHLAQIEEALG